MIKIKIMEKLQGLSSFKADQLSESHASKVLGGEPKATGAGTMESARTGSTGFGWGKDIQDGDTTLYFDWYDCEWA